MQTTTNYNLKQYEGSDLFNPLNVDNPNMGIIDGAMHDNAIHGIGEATETLAGTLHSIVRQNPDCAMFRFVATSDFTYGDSFTVDGIAYTAQMPDGQQMQSNAFVTGSNVLCCLEGSELTFYVTSTGTAPDSDKLGGELPSYYATASDLETVDNKTTTNATAITSVSGQVRGTIEVPSTVMTIGGVLDVIIANISGGDLANIGRSVVKGCVWVGHGWFLVTAHRPTANVISIQLDTDNTIYFGNYETVSATWLNFKSVALS